MMTQTVGAPGSARRYFHSLWLLSARDLRVRYSTSALGYLWSILDPLVMSLIYWFVFTQVFERTVGTEPYIVFLITALLPWVWFNASVTDFTKAFSKDARLVRSTSIPRSIWVTRIILSKGIEFLFSLPVIVFFAAIVSILYHWGIMQRLVRWCGNQVFVTSAQDGGATTSRSRSISSSALSRLTRCEHTSPHARRQTRWRCTRQRRAREASRRCAAPWRWISPELRRPTTCG